jgi:hypothetical protein
MAESGGLIIIDEVLDLMRDDRLKYSGGERIFNHLATLIVTNMVNFSKVKGHLLVVRTFFVTNFPKLWHVTSDGIWNIFQIFLMRL